MHYSTENAIGFVKRDEKFTFYPLINEREMQQWNMLLRDDDDVLFRDVNHNFFNFKINTFAIKNPS